MSALIPVNLKTPSRMLVVYEEENIELELVVSQVEFENIIFYLSDEQLESLINVINRPKPIRM